MNPCTTVIPRSTATHTAVTTGQCEHALLT